MSESADAGQGTGSTGQDTGTDTGPVTGAAGAPGADTDDQEAAGLLGDMLSKDPEQLSAELSKWKEMARKHEKTARANSAAAKRLQEIEDANKTELQRALDAQRAAEEERDTAIMTHNRVMAAAANNLPVELIDDLGSGTEEEINARAERIAQAIDTRARALAEQMAQGNGSGMLPRSGARPVESMRPGSAPATGDTPTTLDGWFRNLVSNR